MFDRLLLTSVALVFFATPVLSQTATEPTVAASATKDCAPQKAKHDHGAERGMPTPKMKCGADEKTAKAKPKAIEGHNHGKVHKNQ